MLRGLRMKQSLNLFKQQQSPKHFPLPSSKPPVPGKVARTRSDTLLFPASPLCPRDSAPAAL